MVSMQEYEVWSDSETHTFSPKEGVERLKRLGLIEEGSYLLHSFSAQTLEEAKAIYHLRMGFEPYSPMGKSEKCPKECGAYYYPKSSGVCPNCGVIC